MASEQRLGASFTIDTTDLKAGLAQANRLIRESESEFKAAAAGMDDWTSSADGLNTRNSHLSKVIDLQKQKVNALQKEYDRLISDGLDPMSKQAVDLRTKINNETTALNKNEKELKQNKEALEQLSDGSDKASKSTDKLKDSTEKTGKGLKALSSVAKIGVAAIAAVAAAAVAGAAKLLGLAESTRELRTQMGRLESGFESANLTAEDATNTYNTLYGVLGDTGKASEAASHLALLANNSEDLAKWTEIATGVYSAFGDSLPIEGLTEAANETAKTGTLTGVLADALNWAGVNEEDFQKKLDACTTEQERQSLITETLSGLYDEQAEKYKEVNKEVIAANEAANNLAQAQADLGAAVEPLNTKITEFKTTLLTELSPALNQIIDDLGGVIDGTAGAPEKLANSISSMISTLLEKAVEVLPTVGEIATQLIGMFVQVVIEQLPDIVNVAMQMFTTFVETLADMIPSLIPTIVETVVFIAETLLDNIDKLVDAGIKLIQALAEGLVDAIPYFVAKIPTIITNLITKLTSNIPKLVQAGVELLIGVANGLIKAIPELVKQLPTIISALVNGLMDAIPQLIEAGGQLALGILKGLGDALWNGIKNIGNSVVNWFKDTFGIHSPSKLMEEEVGSYLGLGIAKGIGEGFDKGIKGVNKSIVKSLDFDSPSINAVGGSGTASAQSGIVVNQYNTYSQAHSRYELFKTKQQTAAAVRLAVGGKTL